MIENNVNNSSSSGVGFVGLLTIAFIVLKLLGVITWKWLWVLAPIWISFSLWVIVIIIIILITFFLDR